MTNRLNTKVTKLLNVNFERNILAIAIEDITKTDLKLYSETAWDEADSFSNKWIEFREDADKSIPKILSDTNISIDQKIKKLSKYGMLSLKPIKEYLHENSEKYIDDSSELYSYVKVLEKENREYITNLASEK